MDLHFRYLVIYHEAKGTMGSILCVFLEIYTMYMKSLCTLHKLRTRTHTRRDAHIYVFMRTIGIQIQ